MQTPTLLDVILKNTYIKSDLFRRVGLLKESLEHTFFSGHPHDASQDLFREFLREKGVEGSEDANMILEWGDIAGGFTDGNIHERLANLDAEIKEIPTIIVYIPMLFGAQEYKRLGAWFREQVSPRMVLDIKIDPSVAGGCAFVWKGIYHDFSFKNFMSKHEAELKEAIRIYGRPS
ncbi:MAG: hypothetical protein UY07_C0014G0010 [Parcubacteria group bacterium GW2011_GWA1_47_8]|uniref:ATP synthase subunit delta n=1 Tax=Candidatus Gottesmanbacteria bacterium GW2011_GWA2_42_18 TaxID=1618442 RepID=A0A0G0ZBX6_9BACT|nr:MAG: hypothetical protein UV09_C0020G0007 [Candidatus Gottesmanbacteria bacterium GW2011_GWA2_42_18]KKU81590.1 MAG: hypothetical protein UY07_C0014G0010 [Parcubacteria group bacterium GW2011_GWA1_47_8]